MTNIVHVALGERSYDIHIGDGLHCGAPWSDARRVLIVTDSNVDALHGAACEQRIAASGRTVRRVVVPAGEKSKDLQVAMELYREAVRAGLDRSSVIFALGGGMVGDLAGYVAATYLRGIRLVQAPTTLLAMVDSSIGGKTGVNLPEGKNLVGAFHQPCEVAIDLGMLRTLPEREYRSGLAEVVKYGVISDADLFALLEREADAVAARDAALMGEVVRRCCAIKAGVVSRDERETGERAMLNFGHTFGHALEKAGAYRGMLHGEAVAVGMMYAADLSVRQQGLAASERARLAALLRRLKLPLTPAEAGVTKEPAALWTELRAAMGVDKKTLGGVVRFVLAESIGTVHIGCAVAEQALSDAFAGMVTQV